MCDRRSQEDEFRNFLRQTAGREAGPPVLCLIHGGEGGCHESLVERLAYHAELLAGKRESREGVAVKVIKIPWQHEGTVEIRLGRLIGWLFERVGTGPGFRFDDTSPAALAGLLASSHSPFVFLQHDIRAARWDDLTKSLIQSYRGYLSELPIGPAGPGVIVCLNIIYPKNPSDHVSRFGFDPRSFVYKRKKARVCRELSEIAAIGARGSKSTICPCLLLDELKPIHRDDVLEWFSFHNILETEEQRLNAAKRIFGNSRAMPDYMRMAEIETHLREVQHAFLVERGFL